MAFCTMTRILQCCRPSGQNFNNTGKKTGGIVQWWSVSRLLPGHAAVRLRRSAMAIVSAITWPALPFVCQYRSWWQSSQASHMFTGSQCRRMDASSAQLVGMHMLIQPCSRLSCLSILTNSFSKVRVDSIKQF